VEKGDNRLDAGVDQSVDDIVVVEQCLLVDVSTSKGKDTAPGDGEREVWNVESLQAGNVLRVEVVVQIGDVSSGTVSYVTLDTVRQQVPDGWTTAFFHGCSFDLVSRRGNTPDKVRRQLVSAEVTGGDLRGEAIWRWHRRWFGCWNDSVVKGRGGDWTDLIPKSRPSTLRVVGGKVGYGGSRCRGLRNIGCVGVV